MTRHSRSQRGHREKTPVQNPESLSGRQGMWWWWKGNSTSGPRGKWSSEVTRGQHATSRPHVKATGSGNRQGRRPSPTWHSHFFAVCSPSSPLTSPSHTVNGWSCLLLPSRHGARPQHGLAPVVPTAHTRRHAQRWVWDKPTRPWVPRRVKHTHKGAQEGGGFTQGGGGLWYLGRPLAP